MDLGSEQQVTGIVTQARGTASLSNPQYVTAYTVSVSSDGITWTAVHSSLDGETQFTGNTVDTGVLIDVVACDCVCASMLWCTDVYVNILHAVCKLSARTCVDMLPGVYTLYVQCALTCKRICHAEYLYV